MVDCPMVHLVSGSRQLRRALFQQIQSNVLDQYLDEGLAEMVLQLLSQCSGIWIRT